MPLLYSAFPDLYGDLRFIAGIAIASMDAVDGEKFGDRRYDVKPGKRDARIDAERADKLAPAPRA